MKSHAFAPFLMLACLVSLVAPALAAPPPKPPGHIPVLATIADSAGGSWLRVQSDTKGAYTTTSQVQSNIVQNMNGSSWILTTYELSSRGSIKPSDRSVFFDLTEQASIGSFPTPVSTAYMPAHLIAKCYNVGVDMLSMATGQEALCPGSFRFWAPSGLWYRLSFEPVNFPGVDRLKVTCTVSDPTGCKVWTITPSGNTLTGGDPNPKNRSRLLQIDAAGNILAVGGEYYLSFSITVAR